MKIYGMTYNGTCNYGTSLQAYALQETIESFGHQYCQIVHHLKRSGASPHSVYVGKSFRQIMKECFRSQRQWFRYLFFKKFEDQHMHFTPQFCDGKRLQALNGEADAFVCGSDVIWNPQFNRGDPAFFLDFAEKYKFSYAASFGSFAPDEQTEQQLREYLPGLDGISVRESSAVEIVREYTGKPVHHVVDPVLLLKKEQWEKLADYSAVPRKPYIFVYTTHMNAVTRDAMNRIQKELALPTVHIVWLMKDAIKERALRFPSQPQWLGLLMNAEYVITNSFHGTAFSVLLEKNFTTIVDGDATKNSNARMYSFLEKLGLEKRIFSKVGNDLELSQPDFTYADQVLTQWRADSMQYIKDNLDAAEARMTSG